MYNRNHFSGVVAPLWKELKLAMQIDIIFEYSPNKKNILKPLLIKKKKKKLTLLRAKGSKIFFLPLPVIIKHERDSKLFFYQEKNYFKAFVHYAKSN